MRGPNSLAVVGAPVALADNQSGGPLWQDGSGPLFNWLRVGVMVVLPLTFALPEPRTSWCSS